MNELLFGNITEKEALENILAYNQIKKCDNEINKYADEIEAQKEEMKNILKNENIDDEYIENIHKYKNVLKNMSGDNSRIVKLDELISNNENRIQEFQTKIIEIEDTMNSLKNNIYSTEEPSEVIDYQNQIETLNVRLNDLNEILNQLVSENTPLLIEREYLVAKNGDNDLNIPNYDKNEVKKQLSDLEEEFDEMISKLDLPVRENIEFCQKKIKNRENEIEKFNQRKEAVINSFPNSIRVNIEEQYNNIETLLKELNLKEITDEEETTFNIEEPEEVKEEIQEEVSEYEEDMIDEMGDLNFEEEPAEIKEEIIEEPAIDEPNEEPAVTTEESTVENVPTEESIVEESAVPAETTEDTPEEVASVSYVLSAGESLVNIAEKVYPSKDNWLAIYYFNKDVIDKYLVSNGISNDLDTITELANDGNLFAGIKLEIPTDYNYKI